MNLTGLLALCLCLIFVSGADSKRTGRLKDQVSILLPRSQLRCFRLLNATHQVGCQSDRNGNVGTIVTAQNERQLAEIVQTFGKNDEKIIPLLKVENLNRAMTEILHKSDVVSGVLFYGKHENANISEDANSPSLAFSLYGNETMKWNEKSALSDDGLRFLDWTKPIFYITDKREIDLLYSGCLKAFNLNLLTPTKYQKDGPRCRVKMSMFMQAAGDAQTCLRRQQLLYGFTKTLSLCDPLSSSNIFYMLPELHKETPANVFLISSKLDSFSLFNEAANGDVSVLTSVITLITLADAIGKKLELFQERAQKHNRQLMLAFFNGESFLNIGSSRTAFDMQIGEFPTKQKKYISSKTTNHIGLDDIKFFLDLQHMNADTQKYYFHVDGQSYKENKGDVDKSIEYVKRALFHAGLVSVLADSSESSQVPPSSYQAFLRHNRSIPGFVLSPDKSGEYHSSVINSFADDKITNSKDSRSQLIDHIDGAASALMQAITGYVHNDPLSASDFSIDRDYISTVVDCLFSNSWNCSYFKQIIPDYQDAYATRSLYVGTKASQSHLWYLVDSMLVQSLGQTHATQNVKSVDQCDSLNPGQSVYRYIWAYNKKSNASLCYRTSSYRTSAESPAFTDVGIHPERLNYSTWVESVWDQGKVEVFLDCAHSTIGHYVAIAMIVLTVLLLSCPSWHSLISPVIDESTETDDRELRVRYQATAASPNALASTESEAAVALIQSTSRNPPSANVTVT
uniref:Nicastrin n=1 Tax=Panagrellus redivivus TaxID=6233 RepID=A0A7E4VWR5_PANRE